MPSAGGFREDVENVKIRFLSHNFMANVGGVINTQEAQSRNMMNICPKYACDILIISGSCGGHRRNMTYEIQKTINNAMDMA